MTPGNVITRESTDTYAVDDPAVQKALRFIADNFHKNIQVLDIVDQLSISRRSLELRFSKIVGHSINEEINRLKINALKRLLVEENDKINVLHKKVGYSSPQHMRRVFKKVTGMSPGEFQQEHKN